jgi:hypothetical protein
MMRSQSWSINSEFVKAVTLCLPNYDLLSPVSCWRLVAFCLSGINIAPQSEKSRHYTMFLKHTYALIISWDLSLSRLPLLGAKILQCLGISPFHFYLFVIFNILCRYVAWSRKPLNSLRGPLLSFWRPRAISCLLELYSYLRASPCLCEAKGIISIYEESQFWIIFNDFLAIFLSIYQPISLSNWILICTQVLAYYSFTCICMQVLLL